MISEFFERSLNNNKSKSPSTNLLCNFIRVGYVPTTICSNFKILIKATLTLADVNLKHATKLACWLIIYTSIVNNSTNILTG